MRHGSNNSVAEFYGEFFSNSDLSKFLSLSGLPTQAIPDSNVLGDLANDQAKPGGEELLPNLDTEAQTQTHPPR